MRRSTLILFVTLVALPATSLAVDVYRTDFDGLTLGLTQAAPGDPGQDLWYWFDRPADTYGEIQDVFANTGRALHQHVAATTPSGTQEWDARDLVDPDLVANPIVTLSLDFYAHTSSQAAGNIFATRCFVSDWSGGAGPRYDMLVFSITAGNGPPKSETKLSIVMYTFDAPSNNNGYLPLSVGQGLDWDSWHSVTLKTDQLAGEYVSITVDGQTQDLRGVLLPRNLIGENWQRGTRLERMEILLYATGDPTLERTDDDIYLDNLSITAEPPPVPCDDPQYLFVGSRPCNVPITISPEDCGGLMDGSTPFERAYPRNEVVTLTAPDLSGSGYTFVEWRYNGQSMGSNPVVQVTLAQANSGAMAVYAPAPPAGLVIYESDFECLTLGSTWAWPGHPGQDEWFSSWRPADCIGEIEDALANPWPGRALHQHIAATTPNGTWEEDIRPLYDPDLTANPIVTLDVDFYGRTSNLQAGNIYAAGCFVRDTNPSCEMIRFTVLGGNLPPKAETKLKIVMYSFNGVDNNGALPLTVGQTLDWETWHHVTLVTDQAAYEYISINVDGQTQDLRGNLLPYGIGPEGWVRGSDFDRAGVLLAAYGDPTNERTDDDIYWDNFSLTAEPAPNPCDDPRYLSVSSVPCGVPITITPADCDALSDGTTPIERAYPRNEVVTLTAPDLSGSGYSFVEWRFNGVGMGSDPALQVTVTQMNNAAVAVYSPATPPEGVVVYESTFDCATLGPTLAWPGHPGQEGWYLGVFSPGQFGEIQATIANIGRALHEHTGLDNREPQWVGDYRPLTPPDLVANPYIRLLADFYCTTSDLDAENAWAANLRVWDHTHPGYIVVNCDLRCPPPKRERGVSLWLEEFNGGGNSRIPLIVGQGLAFDTWHSVQIIIDEAAGTYVAIAVDDQAQGLTGKALPRVYYEDVWRRGTQMQTLHAELAAANTEFVQTADDVYWDNVSLTAAPPPSVVGGCCLTTGDCFLTSQEICASLPGSTYFGDGTTCDSQPCPCTICPPNDECANAIPVGVPSTTMGDTRLARNDDYAPVCPGTAPQTAPGVWYKVVGTGTTITATGCYSAPFYDMQMAVYCDDCGNLVCVTGNDDGCWGGYGEPSTVSWCARAGMTYLIRVYGWGGATGTFQLDITDDAAPCQATDLCAGACCVGPTCAPDQSEVQCQTQSGVWMGAGSDCFPNPCVPVDYYLNTATGEQGGTGTGWILYPSGWLNQWWPNEFDLNRQKQVDLAMWVEFAGPAPVVAVNYAPPEWTDSQNPPTDDAFVVRVPVDPPITTPGYYAFTTRLPFCPLWVSVDVVSTGGDFSIQGTIIHQCLAPTLTGACCVGTVCTPDMTEADCLGQVGGVWKGVGSVCLPVPTACFGDADCSREIDFDDINYFVAALAGGEPGWRSYYRARNGGLDPPCTYWNCDANGSGQCADPQAPEVDFDDINPFVAELVTPPRCP